MKIMAFALAIMLLLAVVGAQKSYACNPVAVPGGSPYAWGILSILSLLQDGVGSMSHGDDYMVEITSGGGPIYGQACCNPRFQYTCGDCIGVLSQRLQNSCPNANGAQYTWSGFCFLRYESYKFY